MEARAHGCQLSAQDERLLRGPPPDRALRWCAAALGGADVVAVTALAGGTSSAVHALDLRSACGRMRRVVLRRYVRADWLQDEPDIARREAAALRLVSAVALPTPQLLAVDESGDAAGAPAVLMAHLDGAVVWSPAELEPYLATLAALLPAIHATPVPADAPIPPYRPYALRAHEPPSWTTRPRMWRRAFQAFEAFAAGDGPPQRGPARCLVHRDFHPGNVLWRDGVVSGVVDWPNASVGAPGADVGHCRMNLARAIGLHAADRFTALHRAIGGGGEHDPSWDIAAALGGFDAAELEARTAREEEFLARAVSRL